MKNISIAFIVGLITFPLIVYIFSIIGWAFLILWSKQNIIFPHTLFDFIVAGSVGVVFTLWIIGTLTMFYSVGLLLIKLFNRIVH